MLRRIGLGAAWVAATLVSILIAGTAVSGVREQVTDSRVTLPAQVAAPLVTSSSAIPATPSTALSVAPTNTQVESATPMPADPPVADPVPTATTDAPATPWTTTLPDEPPSGENSTTTTSTTTAPPPPSTSTTTTAPPASTTTTSPAYETSQHQLLGGVVVLRWRPDEVFVSAATPNPGFEVEIEKSGPDAVEVKFSALDEDDEYEGELHAEWRDGVLEVDLEEGSESGS